MKINEVLHKATIIRDYLQAFEDDPTNPIDINLLPIPPFKLSNDIKLIIMGQDPTIRNEERREDIEFTLNLNKKGSLKNYIEDICTSLNYKLENIYATNLYKYFYSKPPADTPDVLKKHLAPNLKLLKQEIESYPGVPILTLGEPVLKLLCKDAGMARVANCWDYDKLSKKSNESFRSISAEKSFLDREFFPMPHQPSLRKEFYSTTLGSYLKYINNNI